MTSLDSNLIYHQTYITPRSVTINRILLSTPSNLFLLYPTVVCLFATMVSPPTSAAVPPTPDEEHSEFPFDVSLAPPTLDANADNDAPGQEDALTSAMLGPAGDSDNSYGFFDEDSEPVALITLQRLQSEGDTRAALSLLDSRRHITFGGSHTVDATDSNLMWNMNQSFLDLLVCVGNGLGLGPAIPNYTTHHALEFKLDLTRLDRQFTAKHVRLGFDPTECVVWIGKSPNGEDVWLAFVTPESQEDNGKHDSSFTPNRSSRKGTSTAMTLFQQRRVFMFLATLLQQISYRDCTVNNKYPTVELLADFENATNLW